MWSPNLLFQVFDQGRHARGGLAAVERGGHYPVMLVGTVLPGHVFIRVGLAPPIGRVGAEARQEQGARVGVEDLGADVVDGLPVRWLTGRGPRRINRVS